MEYYLQMDCPECGHENYQRGFNAVEHEGLPVFDIESFGCQGTSCEECDTYFGTGDVDLIII